MPSRFLQTLTVSAQQEQAVETLEAVRYVTQEMGLHTVGRKNAIVLPSLGSDTAAPFTMAVTLQLIALKLTEVRGIDPDVSDVLNKVTVTM